MKGIHFVNHTLALITFLSLAPLARLQAAEAASAVQPPPAAVDFDLQGFVDGRLKRVRDAWLCRRAVTAWSRSTACICG